MRFPKKRERLEIAQAHDGFHVRLPESKSSNWLNRTAYLCLVLSNGASSETQISNAIKTLFDLSFDPAAQVRKTLQKLKAAGLIEYEESGLEPDFKLLVSVWAPGESVSVATLTNLNALTENLKASNIRHRLMIDPEPSHQLSRDRTLSAVANSDSYSHVLLLDARRSAIEAINSINLIRLLQSGLELVCVPVRTEEPNWAIAAKALLSEPELLRAVSHTYNISFSNVPKPAKKVGEFRQASFVGSQALLISKAGLARLTSSKLVPRYRGFLGESRKEFLEQHWGFFTTAESSNRLLTGEIAFCERFTQSGGTLMVDTQGQFGESLRGARILHQQGLG